MSTVSSGFPQWMGRSLPLEVFEELVLNGLCGYCVLRFTACRAERLYKMFENDLNQALFPSDLISANEALGDALIDRGISGKDVAQRFMHMKDTLFNRDTCTSCLDICPPNKAFFAFIAQTVRAADYEFDSFSHWKTLPASIILRQFGLWVHMRDKFPNVTFYQQPSYENHIVELKEALKFSQPVMITTEINRLRAIDNGTVEGDVATVYLEDSSADYPDITRSPYAEQPQRAGLPHMHVDRADINKSKAFCAALAPFKVHTVFHTERPENEGELRSHMSRLHAHRGRDRGNGDAMSISGNLMRNLAKLSVDTLRSLGVVPPTLPSRPVDLGQATGGFIRNKRKRREALKQTQAHSGQEPAPATEDAGDGFVPLSLDGLPLSIAATMDATNGVPPGQVLQLSPYVTVQVSCQHNNVLLEGNYLKLSRLISHSSWYENPAHAPEGLVTAPVEAEKPAKDEQSPARKKKRFEDLEDSEDEEEAQGALTALLTRKDDEDSTNVFAESSVEAEIAHRMLPHFRPGAGHGYAEFGRDGRAPYERGSLAATGLNPYSILQHAGYLFKFHSSGREDLNVRMLGNGRPFFLELVDPHRVPPLTHAALQALQAEICAHSTLVKVHGLRVGDAASFATMVKGIGEKRKRYRCVVHCTRRIADDAALAPLNTAGDLHITQLTPIRVLFRRAALARSRHVNNLRARRLNDHWFVLDLETQAGTYVKEFVHSDRGRSFPSVTSLLGAQCDIIQLDVTELIL